MPAECLIVIPTYNEVENIEPICVAIFRQIATTHILVVDDHSTDGTKQVLDKLLQTYAGRLHLIERSGKLGLGTAYLAGFAWALEREYPVVIQMDADFSHPVDRLPAMLEALKTRDVVIGSRYVDGGQVTNWGLVRRLISKFGSFYARTILGMSVRDLTGGFNGWRRTALIAIDRSSVRSEGYSFQIELKYRAHRAKLSIVEIPIEFRDRRAGQSKMSAGIVVEAMYRVWQIRGH